MMEPELRRVTIEALDALRQRRDEQLQLLGYLKEARFSLAGIRAFLQLADPPWTVLGRTALYSFLLSDELLGERSALGVLIQLFFLGGRVPAAAFAAALPAGIRDLLLRNALVAEVDGRMVEGCVAIVEVDDRYFLSDKLFRNLGGGRVEMVDDPVMPMHASSCELFLNLSHDPAARTFLDVGCGSGCQAILTAHRYARLVGFDLDPRAVAFARLNAALNAVDAQFVVADGLTFDDGTRYDHISFNAEAIPRYRTPGCDSLGYELLLPFLSERLDLLLAPGGSCQVWTSFFLTYEFDSIEQFLERSLRSPERFSISANVLERSPFTVTAADLERGTIPRSSYLANDAAEREQLLEFVRRNRVREILATVLTIRRA